MLLTEVTCPQSQLNPRPYLPLRPLLRPYIHSFQIHNTSCFVMVTCPQLRRAHAYIHIHTYAHGHVYARSHNHPFLSYIFLLHTDHMPPVTATPTSIPTPISRPMLPPIPSFHSYDKMSCYFALVTCPQLLLLPRLRPSLYLRPRPPMPMPTYSFHIDTMSCYFVFYFSIHLCCGPQWLVTGGWSTVTNHRNYLVYSETFEWRHPAHKGYTE